MIGVPAVIPVPAVVPVPGVMRVLDRRGFTVPLVIRVVLGAVMVLWMVAAVTHTPPGYQ